MLILLKHRLKTTLILIMFIYGGTYLSTALTLQNNCLINTEKKNLVNCNLNHQVIFDKVILLIQDTLKTEKKDTTLSTTIQNVSFTIPSQWAKTSINFRINSAIEYLSFNHFVKNESKKIFYQAWLLEKYLKRLSIQTDSLRKAYTEADIIKKEEISLLILNAEKEFINLNQEIPLMYKNARDKEDQYWQSVSDEQILKFQDRINGYRDSILQISNIAKSAKSGIQPEIHDTIILEKTSPKTADSKVTEPSNVVYKIQVGAYKGKIPESANKLIKKLSVIRKVEKYTDEKGITIYTTGNLKNYQDAVTLQNQVKQEGIKNAMITAYQNGKKIPINAVKK